MTDYTEIVNAYMKFFACHLLESVDDTKTKMYFEDIYSFKKQFHKNIEKCIYELHIPDINSTKEKDILALLDAVISSLRNKIRNQLKEIDSRERKNIFYMLAAFQAEFHGRVNVIADGADLDLTSAHPLTSNCMLGEAEKIFAYMLVDESKEVEKLSESPEKDNNRLFEKCILRVGKDRYLYSHILIGYAYLILLRKLEFNLLEKCERLNAPIIDKNIKKKFEEETQLYIKQYCSNVLLNVHKLDDGAVLSNEVDVMFAMNGNLYIVECKDVTFRYTPNGFIADVRKEREFVKDMIAKRKSVIDNITYFERKFEQKINEVKGYLVYRTTNFVTETVKEDKNVVLVSFEKFKRMLSRM